MTQENLRKIVVALRDCVMVMENELGGLRVIQPELRQAKDALELAKLESAALVICEHGKIFDFMNNEIVQDPFGRPIKPVTFFE